MVVKVVLIQKSFLKTFDYEIVGRLAAQTQFIRNRMAYPHLIDCQFFKELKSAYIKMYDHFYKGEDFYLVFPHEFLNDIPDIELFYKKLEIMLSKNLGSVVRITLTPSDSKKSTQDSKNSVKKF